MVGGGWIFKKLKHNIGIPLMKGPEKEKTQFGAEVVPISLQQYLPDKCAPVSGRWACAVTPKYLLSFPLPTLTARVNYYLLVCAEKATGQ